VTSALRLITKKELLPLILGNAEARPMMVQFVSTLRLLPRVMVIVEVKLTIPPEATCARQNRKEPDVDALASVESVTMHEGVPAP